MEETDRTLPLLRFGVFEADLCTGELRKAGIKVRLQEQPFRVLAHLLRKPGELVTREELRQSLWPNDTFVDFDQGLNKAVNKLRLALHDSAQSPRYIETLSKRGYRFLAEVTSGAAVWEESNPSFSSTPSHAALLKEKLLEWRSWGAAACIGIMGSAIVFWYLGGLRSNPKFPNAASAGRFSIVLPEQAPVALVGSAPLGYGRPSLALSPDGTHLVYVADVGGASRLYIRQIGETSVAPISGTEGAYNPFFSPDGEWVGFFASNQLKKASLKGGSPFVLCEVANPLGACWGPGDTIFFVAAEGKFVSRVSARGGNPRALAIQHKGQVRYFAWPEVLPGGKALLVTSYPGFIYALSTETGELKLVHRAGPTIGTVRYLPTGHLLYSHQGQLLAAPFNLEQLEVTGAAVPVVERVRTEASAGQGGAGQYAVSLTGTLIYIPGGSVDESQLVWVNRQGQMAPLEMPSRVYADFDLSPDGQRLAILVLGTSWDIWIYDLVRGMQTRFTQEWLVYNPRWTPDGKRVAYLTVRAREAYLAWKVVEGNGEAELLASGYLNPNSWSFDGRFLAVEERHYDKTDISIYSEKTLHPFANSPAIEWGPAFSPNGKWLAYTSDESGQFEVYVQQFPATGEKWKISVNGGEEPVWSPNGKELFYRDGRSWLAAAIKGEPDFVAELPNVMFSGNYLNVPGRSYQIAPDGKRFLLIKGTQPSSSPTQLNVVLNWFTELNRLVPPAK